VDARSGRVLIDDGELEGPGKSVRELELEWIGGKMEVAEGDNDVDVEFGVDDDAVWVEMCIQISM